MKIEDFWNAAFLAALHRLPVPQAKEEADLATNVCIDHWHANWENRSTANAPRVQDIEIGSVYRPAKADGTPNRDLPRLWGS
ncbi:hypothetical protein [Xanthomonas perforans]|uniref:hypothetical protein n=1 Tax=Xanthomonas TaxID=338 RepID=UPI00321B561C